MIDGSATKATIPVTLRGRTIKQKKKAFIEYFFKSSGNISFLCQQIGINRKTFYRWMENDPDFREKILSEDEAFTDMAETQHHNLVAAGHYPSVQFHLRTKGKDRGYAERPEQVAINQMNISQEMKITIVHTREDDAEFLKEFEDEINREVLPE